MRSESTDTDTEIGEEERGKGEEKRRARYILLGRRPGLVEK
jgi:hypothetical protein